MKKIYTLTDPRTNQIRYVGQTKCKLNSRLNGHIRDAITMRYNIPKSEWIMELINEDTLPLINEIEIVKNKDADFREQFWIKYYSDKYPDLLNATFGVEHIRFQEYKTVYGINRYTLQRVEFETARQAGKFINTTGLNVIKAISGKHICKDYYWSRNEFPKNWEAPILKNKIGIKLYNDEKCLLFSSIKDAIEFTNGNVASHKNGAHYAIVHRPKLYRGFFWDIQKEAQLKRGEMLEKPVEVNQQPSLNSNILEGSTTNTRIQTGNAEDSNSDTSALPTNV